VEPVEPPVDPLLFLASRPASQRARWLYSPEDCDVPALAGFGRAVEATGAGDDRFASLEREMAAGGAPAGAVWLGGAAFDSEPRFGWSGYPAAWLCVPEVLLHGTASAQDLVVTTCADRLPEAIEDARLAVAQARAAGPNQRRTALQIAPAARSGVAADRVALGPELLRRLARALAEVREGAVSKLVVASELEVSARRTIDPLDLLARLASRQPGCALYLVSPYPGDAWLGATPEKLVAVSDNRVDAMALAGSAPRGADSAEDDQLADALMASAKERVEHRIVVDAVRESLQEAGVIADCGPRRLRRLATLQHIQTELSGARPMDVGLLDIVARLHPTPALGGEPRGAALRAIRGLEPGGRGWYGGLVGWAAATGEGEMSVAIRGLRVRGRRVTARAGAGIVADSDIEREAREIELKLAAALGAVDEPVTGHAVDAAGWR